jgi:hypothetical protein
MGLLEDLRTLADQLKKRLPHVKNEEATKQALIVPFLQVLGYDIYDPTEVQPEFVSDFAKKRPGGPSEKVDYAIHLRGEVVMFIECKSVGTSLELHDGQLARYFNATPTVKAALVTNGTRYRFFTDLQTPNVMDPTPFFEFDVLTFSERDVETLRGFSKEQFSGSAVHDQAEELIFTGKVTGLVQELFRNPSENFVRFLLGEANLIAGRVTARIVDRFTPIVKKAIQTSLVDLMTKSIQQEIAPAPDAPAPAPAVAALAAPVAPRGSHEPQQLSVPQGPSTSADGRIVTSEDELQVFEVVKKLCAESSVGKPIAFKDTASYFGINLGGVRSWFIRYIVRDDRRWIVLRLPLEKAQILAPGFKVEAAPEYQGGSRVFFKASSELEKLHALIVTAYEDESRRKDTSADEDEPAAAS